MNTVILIGRLARDPDYREGQTNVTRATVAVDRGKDRNGNDLGADFISCVAFGKAADGLNLYFHKGNRIAVQGHIRTGSYTNKEGAKVYTTDVIVDHWEFAENKKMDSKPAPTEDQKQPNGPDGFMNVPDEIDEELPFN